MTAKERAVLIAQYKDGYKKVVEAIEGITDGELDYSRAPGKWTSREIVHHLADSETTGSGRLRRLIVEHQPYIQGYDEEAFAKKLQYSKRPIAAALKAIESVREVTAEIFNLMSEEDWKRTGEHSESGPYSVEIWLKIYSVHAHNHADQIMQNRKAYKEKK